MLETPIWITNFKNYESSVGRNGLELAKIHERVAQEMNISVGVAVSNVDLYRIAKEVSIPVLAQHVDPIDYGKCTGHILPQAVKKAGAIGTLLNHSERRLDLEVLEYCVSCAQKATLKRIICAESPEEVEQFVGLYPDFIAYEPPELIGSSKASVASAKPDSIRKSVKLAGDIPLLVGAGINTSEDVKISLELGAKGFLVASAITKAADPEKKLRELLSAFPTR
ncbi:triose-phosphate isomerase [Candidatus Gracilibacteria bacterium]|nr:triose-phosphate isomerase [Candidatus Gracilibacteria bacterium]MCF7819237.1 triose-phosphate isomerase [Candidatus Gracilibacteria bacterium]